MARLSPNDIVYLTLPYGIYGSHEVACCRFGKVDAAHVQSFCGVLQAEVFGWGVNPASNPSSSYGTLNCTK